MSETSRIAMPGPRERTIRTAQGIVEIPSGWILVPPGDPALTRRLKATETYWMVQEKRGRKVFSRGLWAPGEVVEAIQKDLVVERQDPAHARKRATAARRREEQQAEYVQDFCAAVQAFLAFAPAHAALAKRLAEAVTHHATPVGSGTVARTKRISVEQRAEAAVIAWMRHQTTAYDSMAIPRIKGMRRDVRRQLAQRSREILRAYRSGINPDPDCPLAWALGNPSSLGSQGSNPTEATYLPSCVA